MKIHQLKIWPQHFDDVLAGRKKYEVRFNDRDFEVGDHLMLAEWDPAPREYTGRSCVVCVVHMTAGTLAAGGVRIMLLPAGVCVMGIEFLP